MPCPLRNRQRSCYHAHSPQPVILSAAKDLNANLAHTAPRPDHPPATLSQTIRAAFTALTTFPEKICNSPGAPSCTYNVLRSSFGLFSTTRIVHRDPTYFA